MENYNGFKNCPACGTMLRLPDEYLNAIANVRRETEKFRDVLIRDFIQADLKPMLFRLARSHSKLAQAEYNRDPSYNDSHFSHKAEETLISFMSKFGLIDEFLIG